MAEENEAVQQRLYIMRHGERIDFVFKKWISDCFDKSGKYLRKDLNMPATILKKKNVPAGYIRDGPLTNIGRTEAELIGKYFRDNGIKLNHVFSSPAYRCLETTQCVLQEMDRESAEVDVNIEPGLFEWMGWYSALPDFFHPTEFKQNGYNINTTYTPVMPLALLETNLKESMEEFYQRGHKVSTALTTNCQTGNILLVCHGGTLDALSRELVGGNWRTKDEADRVMANVPYCSLLGLERRGDEWGIVDLPESSIMHGCNEAFCCDIMLDK